MAFSNPGHTNSADDVSGPKGGFKERWVKGKSYEQAHPAVLADGKIYYGSISGLFARNLNDGTKVWSRSFQGNGAPVITDTSAIFPLASKIISLNASNGERNWIYTPESGNVPSETNLTLANGLTFVPASADTEDLLYAVDTETGEPRWTYRKENMDLGIITSQVSDGNNLYFSFGGKFRAVGLDSGNEMWTIDTRFWLPVLNAGQIYLSGTNRDDKSAIQAVNTTDGSTIWTHETGAPQRPDIVPATNGNAVYTPTSDGIGALSTSDGSELWSYKLVEPLAASPTVADGVVYAMEGNGRIHALAADTGKQMATAEFGDMGGPQSPAIGTNNTIYVPSVGGIYALSQ